MAAQYPCKPVECILDLTSGVVVGRGIHCLSSNDSGVFTDSNEVVGSLLDDYPIVCALIFLTRRAGIQRLHAVKAST